MVESFFVFLTSAGLLVGSWLSSPTATPAYAACASDARYERSAAKNAMSLESAELAPFGRSETGWRIYAPQVAATIGTLCAPQTSRFAAALGAWQAKHRLRPTGAVDPATLGAMKNTWQQARPFIAAFSEGGCPDAASEKSLVDLRPREGWLGKPGKLDARALAALRRMAAAARTADPRIARDRQMLTIISAYRSPEYDAEKCKGGACNGVAKARCSAHRTGTAVDLYVGAAPGKSPVASDDENRLYQTNTATYRWLVKNAARYGFVNYVFEPWHWEWVEPEDTTLISARGGERARRALGDLSAAFDMSALRKRLALLVQRGHAGFD